MDDYVRWLEQKILEKKQKIDRYLKNPELPLPDVILKVSPRKLLELEAALATYLDYQDEVQDAKST
jgi:hypothetical protein